MNTLRTKLIFLVIIAILFSSCVSTKNATSYAVDYEEEHKPKQDFDFNNTDALDLCKSGWFIINELNDSFYMKNLTSKMTEEEINQFYNDKITTSLNSFEDSNNIEVNYWNYRGIAEINTIARTQFMKVNSSWSTTIINFGITDNNSQTDYNKQLDLFNRNIITNYIEAYKINPETVIYNKILSSIKNLQNEEDLISTYDYLLSLETDNEKRASLYYNKGIVYKDNGDFQKAYSEFNTAFDLSTDIDNYDNYFSMIKQVKTNNDSELILYIDTLIKQEKNNNKLAYFYYQMGLLNLKFIEHIEAYNSFTLAKNSAEDEKLKTMIDNKLSNISNDYQSKYNDFFKKLIVANKAGFRSDDEYQAYLKRVDFENLYRSLNRGYDTNYQPGDIVVAPAQRLSITDVEQASTGYLYLITGYGQNQLSKCCMIVSSYQLQYVSWYGEGLITEQMILVYQGKSTYKRGYTIVDCDLFTVVNPGSPLIKDFSEKLNEAVKYDKWEFDYILENLTAEEYQLLINNHFIFAFYPDVYSKVCYACYSETIDASLKKKSFNSKGWKKVFDYILSSPFELSKKDYWYLCEAFNSSDDFNTYLEKYIDIPGANPKWFHDSYLYQKKNFKTVLSHLKDIKSESKNYWNYLGLYGIDDEVLIKTLIQKGLDVSLLNPLDFSFDISMFIGHQTPKTIQLFIDNGFDINTFISLWGDNGAYLLTTIIELYEQEEHNKEEHRIRKDTIDFLISKGAKR